MLDSLEKLSRLIALSPFLQRYGYFAEPCGRGTMVYRRESPLGFWKTSTNRLEFVSLGTGTVVDRADSIEQAVMRTEKAAAAYVVGMRALAKTWKSAT